MNRTYINEVQKEIGNTVKVQGFIENLRNSKYMAFIVLKDITGKLQITVEKEDHPDLVDTIDQLTPDSVITVTGIVSCVYCLDYNMHMPLGFLSDLCHTFPLYSLGLGWAGAAAAAALMSHLAYRLRSRRVSQNETEAAA